MGLDDSEKTDITNLCKYLDRIGGYTRASRYLRSLLETPDKITLGPVALFRHPLVVPLRQRPTAPPGPERMIAHQLRVSYKRPRE